MNPVQDKESPAIYNSRLIDTYLKLIKRKYSFVNIGELLSYAGMEAYEVADQGHWFTQEQVNRFSEKVRELTGNPNIDREAGRYSASPEAIGIMRQYILGMMDPGRVYELLSGLVAGNFTRSAEYKAKKVGPNKVEIVVTPRAGYREEPYQCESRMGYFEAIANIFNHKVLEIEHPECMFREGKVCHYTISWKKSLSDQLKMTRIIAGGAALLAFSGYAVVDPSLAFNSILPLAVIMMLIISLMVEKVEKKELSGVLDNFRGSTDKLVEQTNINYNNALMTNEIGQVISRQNSMHMEEYADSQVNIEKIMQNVVQVFEKRLDYRRGLVLLANRDKTKLELKAVFGYEDHIKLLEKVTFHLDRPESQGVFVVSFREQKPFLINDLAEIEDKLSLRSLALAKKLGAKSFICCPIVCDGESVGVLAVDNPRSNRPLVNSDMSLLMGIAPMIGISIRNAEFLDARNRQFKSLMQLLAATIDARDSLTAGHSEKVTEYAVGICQEMGLPANYREMIRVAALLHDYGKIAVPDAVLKKNGRLTETEYEVVKTHSEKTREILEQIRFEGIFVQVPEVAGAHHEKIDGSGYPKGLKGKEIPLGAKIIAVADFFEAITAKRHYREPMPLEVAFRLLHEKSGIHFDHKIVEAFSRYFLKSHLEGAPAGSRPGFWLPRPAELSALVKDKLKTSETDLIVDAIVRSSNQDPAAELQPDFVPEAADNQEKGPDDEGRVVWLDRYKAGR
ncbi:HD domain-containing phosphohydrolase [Desulfurivibrio sp. C05AmB]|uniref:HD domain-containing phosphohydrolase n=1 Tax=Desulfurivibrio sp. C05AmB TaxID=3374371 RepID=UPI00376EE635